jgi:hypothetical protein
VGGALLTDHEMVYWWGIAGADRRYYYSLQYAAAKIIRMYKKSFTLLSNKKSAVSFCHNKFNGLSPVESELRL